MYTKVESGFWRDNKMRGLSHDARYLMLYLLTSPHRNIVGFYFLPSDYACFDLQWEPERFEKAMRELSNAKRVSYDSEYHVVLIKNYLRHNPLENPNQVKNAIEKVAELPDTPLFHEFAEIVERLGQELLAPLLETLRKRCETLPKPFRKGSETVPEPSPNPPETVSKPVTVTGTGSVTGSGSHTLQSPNGGSTAPEPPACVNEPVENSNRLKPARVVELWNAVCGDVLPRVSKLTDQRRRKVLARIAESKDRHSEDWWRSYFERIRASPFLCGSGSRGWRADFDWAVRSEQVVVSVLEGKYARDRPLSRQASDEVADSWEAVKHGKARSRDPPV